jgi:uncharacterized membrane protein YhaH (DUF805 family)
MLPTERHQSRCEHIGHDSRWWDGYRAGRHERWLVAGIGGALLGYLIGRRHPLVWASIAGLLLVIGSVVLVLLPYALGAVAIVVVARWRAAGRSWSRIGAKFGVFLSCVVVSFVVLITLGPGPGLLTVAGSWGLWRIAGRPRLARL